MTAKTLYYPVWVSSGATRGGFFWGKPCDSRKEAAKVLQEKMRSQAIPPNPALDSPFGTVVEMSGGEKIPLAGYVMPMSARKIVQHWEALMQATETPE